ncbi:mitochondrial thiamine pyrophosphate carrier-like [Rhopalosiphum maidis]|uniref:mitochondrial thiamine pyrophosphate carrier-like n=1 Tax=Rhopalosiphum maidis TaxID=43146 RepID=UPI000F005C3E|nr:mitochondrial thiamine pyrophosphate carrier-like [Rhopalosiphum maidis]XP_026820796.1 mitochondrial thiamine pyrophosphate carrier-like [Rhopalosiphum maidis]XP_026820797.1 mitochondrial thiamine pyrophosphate carrier-like [Rhopalosiphum maidis]XP_026820798.1 mitochondrial thiamine pyrophosphate carrier-like [Rhopalosiphum maidis]XP_026820799.1 mitochondrial thiamine pyrophosphate carrier-like [Rhopalosiphum maidis]XP_026820800.1 mitochondrial thiamine pyrophosphate carrier-like [Rhopalosi
MSLNISNTVKDKTWLLHSTAGACSGAFTRLVCQPLDVLKIRFQLQVEPLSKNSNNSKYKSIHQSISLIYKEEGFKALWKGLLPGQFLSTTYGLTQFLVFQKTLALLSTTEKELNQTSSVHFLCGVTSATAATLMSYPFDVVRTRLVAQKSNQVYANMRSVAISMFRMEGVSAYYRGFFPTIMQNALQGGFLFMFYNTFSKLSSTNTSTNTTVHDDRINSVKQFSSGFLAGVSAKTIVYPLDVIKKRLQLQDFVHSREDFGKKFMCNGLLDCIYVTIKEESFNGLFKGLSPSLIKAGFTTALHLTFYEQTLKLLQSLVNNF